MIGLTDHEKDLAIAMGGPATGATIVLAEVSMYFDQHPDGRPEVASVLNLKVDGHTDAEKTARVSSIAKWLGVPMTFRNGTYFAQRRWIAPDGESILVEAHFTPDHDAAFAALQQQAAERGAA